MAYLPANLESGWLHAALTEVRMELDGRNVELSSLWRKVESRDMRSSLGLSIGFLDHYQSLDDEYWADFHWMSAVGLRCTTGGQVFSFERVAEGGIRCR